MNNRYRTVKITAIEMETVQVKNFILEGKIEAKPGQYVMVWLPGENEKPFGVAQTNPLMLSIARIGETTEKIHRFQVGDPITFRGPYGRGFKLKGKRILLVGGGYGVVPLYFLAKTVPSRKRKHTFVIIGARNESMLAYEQKFKDLGCNVMTTTDDGSVGFPVFTTELTQVLLRKNKIDAVYTCGPTPMMKIIAEICEKKKVHCQVSLERMFKCGGLGLCGECSCKGKLVCSDGPVFNGSFLLT